MQGATCHPIDSFSHCVFDFICDALPKHLGLRDAPHDLLLSNACGLGISGPPYRNRFIYLFLKLALRGGDNRFVLSGCSQFHFQRRRGQLCSSSITNKHTRLRRMRRRGGSRSILLRRLYLLLQFLLFESRIQIHRSFHLFLLQSVELRENHLLFGPFDDQRLFVLVFGDIDIRVLTVAQRVARYT